MIIGPGKKPLKRSAPPNCNVCKKYDSETGKIWQGFSRRNFYHFKSFLLCKAFGVLPRVGGTDNQDPGQMDMFILLSEIFEKNHEMRDKNFQLKMMGSMKGLFNG